MGIGRTSIFRGPPGSTVLVPALGLGLLILCGFVTVPAPAQSASRPGDSEPRVKPRDDGPRVTAQGAADLLRPPGEYRSGSVAPDWRTIPPWRQTSFFGIRAEGQSFAYVVDCSGSMIDDNRLVRAKSELRRSIMSLQPPQRFQVIFYNDRPMPLPGGLARSADLTSKGQMNQWLRLIEPDGETDPRGALNLALAQRPDAIFLLSDGEFPAGTAAAVAGKNARKVPIHCIDLSGGLAGDQLARIARESGGQYAARPPRPDEVAH